MQPPRSLRLQQVSDEHRLLLRHFSTWAEKKGRDVDVDLLRTLLDLRATYDSLEPTYWPAGSVDDLLGRRLPSKGPVEPLPERPVVDVLDAYFRFLRSTGRMSGRSAAPADLTAEARRAAKRMRSAAADRSNWSPSKSIVEFGDSIGLPIEGLDSQVALEEQMAQITAAWNDLPIHERRRLNPSGDPSESGRASALAAYGTEDELEALIRCFTYELPDRELQPAPAVATAIRGTELLARLRALTEWIEPRAEVTSTLVLRPAAAHQAFADLGLVEWQRELIRAEYAGSALMERLTAEQEQVLLDSTASMPFKNARDAPALDRLWYAAVSSGLIEFRGRWATPNWPEPFDDEAALLVGIGAGFGLLKRLMYDREWAACPVVGYALLRTYVKWPAPVPLAEVLDFAMSWLLPPDPDHQMGEIYRSMVFTELQLFLLEMRDLAIFDETSDGIALTMWGDLFVTSWLTDCFGDFGSA